MIKAIQSKYYIERKNPLKSLKEDFSKAMTVNRRDKNKIENMKDEII